ncbi:uncharacterized protein LOC114531712, partial [Dendronephthya gigantea]|uniref:uncharacterized protein LOC114531712 n=1 Tax=Dendronephthya gigantea TaxID=151771 RepID=UPI00106C1ADA
TTHQHYDLLVCAIGIPLDIYLQYAESWPYGTFLCHVIYPSQTCLILISILTLMGMSLERHRAICSPLKQRVKPKWLRCSIVCIWLIAIAAVIPYAKILKYTDNDCLENWSVPDNAKYYTLALFMMDYCIPLTIITYCYIRAGYVLHTKFKKFNNKESTSSVQNMATMKRLQQKKKVIKIFSLAVILFVICVLPGDCYWMWFSFRTIESHPLDTHLQAFSTITLYANSAINPFIFGAVQMVCHRNMRSRISDQLTSTTGFSGSVSSAGGDGFNRKFFSRAALRRLTKYRSLRGKMEAQDSNSETKGLNNTKQLDGETKVKYRDMANGYRSDTHKKTCDTNFNLPILGEKMVDKEQNPDDTKQEMREKEILVTNHDTKKGRIETKEEMRDTKEQQLDTKEVIEYEICTSNDTLNDIRSISSDSSATLHREEDDTSSLTSEMIHDTNCKLKERTGSSDYQCYNTNEYTEDERLHEMAHKTNRSKQNEFESSNLMASNNSTKQGNVDRKITIEDRNSPKHNACEKDINNDFSESAASGRCCEQLNNKTAHNLLEFILSRSVKESDV